MNSSAINELIMDQENLREEVLHYAEEGSMIKLVAAFTEMNTNIIYNLLEYYNKALEQESKGVV